jgi:hypothetical protein
MDKIALLEQLILDNGRIDNEQILHLQMVEEFFNPRVPRGLPSGI